MSTPLGGDAGSAPPGDDLRTRIRRVVGRRPTIGAGAAAGAVAQDLRDLVRAEVALAQAELKPVVQAKATGAALFGVAGAAGWLALQGLLITLGLVLALFLPGWAAALIVSVLLLVVAGVAALVGRRQLARPARLDTTVASIQEDLAVARQHLPRR